MIRIGLSDPSSRNPLATTRLSELSSTEGPSLDIPRDKAQPDLHIWRIVIQLPDRNAEFAANVRNPVLFGRADPATGSKPDIDLTSVGGQEHGVSRCHAIMIPTDEGLCVIDLDTANGTFINGQKLTSGQRYRLRSGDRVELGTLRLMVTSMGLVPRGRTPHSTIVMNRVDLQG